MLDIKQLCWDLFSKTGQVKYYMLYKSLEDGDGIDS